MKIEVILFHLHILIPQDSLIKKIQVIEIILRAIVLLELHNINWIAYLSVSKNPHLEDF